MPTTLDRGFLPSRLRRTSVKRNESVEVAQAQNSGQDRTSDEMDGTHSRSYTTKLRHGTSILMLFLILILFFGGGGETLLFLSHRG